MKPTQQQFPRFSLAQRIEHWALALAFIVLAATGLPQKFIGNAWAEEIILAMGGIEQVRLIHRYAAVILMLQTIYHGGVVTYKMAVQRLGLSMAPGWRDARNLFDTLAYNLGLSKLRPKMPRYTFEEKVEYWAMVWGTVIMIITGFMLWNPIATTKFLPGAFIPAAKAAHGGEALLAVLAILVWHMYGVVFRQINRSMFTGQLSRQEMEYGHALELKQIELGLQKPAPPPTDLKRRQILFAPIAAIITLILIYGVYWFVTFEETAISTVIAADEPESSYQPLEIANEGQNIHTEITAYTGPESCLGAGCHASEALDTAKNSRHGQRVEAAGPHPLLAKLADADSVAADPQPDCLLCHAKDYQADDLTASAQSVRAAGGNACRRCHTEHPQEDVHSLFGLACVSCHLSDNHRIEKEVSCQTCHTDVPHKAPILNDPHARMDCLSCHITAQMEPVVDAGQSTQNPVTQFYEPALEFADENFIFSWQTPTGQPSTIENETAKIALGSTLTLLAPAGLDPATYARTGQSSGPNQETQLPITPGHSIFKAKVWQCSACHGKTSTFDYASLGYDKARAEKLAGR